MKQVVLQVAGLWGPNEAAALQLALMRVPGVARAEVDLVSHQAVVHYGSNACVEGLTRMVKAQGWQVTAVVQRRDRWERVFSAVIFPPLVLSTRFFGERAWWIWECLTILTTRLIIWLARPYLRRQGIYGDDVQDLMRIVDLADELVGAEGEWLDNGQGRMGAIEGNPCLLHPSGCGYGPGSVSHLRTSRFRTLHHTQDHVSE